MSSRQTCNSKEEARTKEGDSGADPPPLLSLQTLRRPQGSFGEVRVPPTGEIGIVQLL